MRPEFSIPSANRYEFSFRELMFGMTSVAVCTAHYYLPNLEHLKFVKYVKSDIWPSMNILWLYMP